MTKSLLFPSWKTKSSDHCIADLTIVAKLVSILLALMWADDELEIVSVQKVLGDIRTPVTTSATDLIWNATVLRHGVTPQQVQNLMTQKYKYKCKKRL